MSPQKNRQRVRILSVKIRLNLTCLQQASANDRYGTTECLWVNLTARHFCGIVKPEFRRNCHFNLTPCIFRGIILIATIKVWTIYANARRCERLQPICTRCSPTKERMPFSRESPLNDSKTEAVNLQCRKPSRLGTATP